MAAANLAALFVACNRTTQAAAWGQNVVAFGAFNFVALWNPYDQTRKGVFETLHGHEGRVNCVAVASQNNKDLAIVSGSTDKNLILWTRKAEQQEANFQRTQVLSGHTDSVLAVSVVLHQNELRVASIGAEGNARLWHGSLDAVNVACVQTITFGTKLPLCVALSQLFNKPGCFIMAIGLADCTVSVFVQDAQQQMSQVLTLKGHDDWVRCVTFAYFAEDEMGLCSSSQDKYVRLWQIKPSTADAMEKANTQKAGTRLTAQELLESLESSGLSLKNKASYFSVPATSDVYSVVLDALLIGHEDWVYSVCFQPPRSKYHGKCILTSSMDKTMMVWKPHPQTNVWFNEVRVGDVGGQNVFGFYGAMFSPDGDVILSHGYNGAFHMWRHQQIEESVTWTPLPVPSGHFAPVNDVTWDPTGRYIASASDDQTCRLFGVFRINESDEYSWHEISRAQVHGYELQCISFTRPHEYISGADEKVVRVFHAPQSFMESLSALAKLDMQPEDREAIKRSGNVLSASTPALGLSNKPVFADAAIDDDDDAQVDTSRSLVAAPVPSQLLLSQPPLEEQLIQSTLWAEADKLYGHPYEIFCSASDHTGRFAATACKATQPEHAIVRLWAIDQGFKAAGTLAAHTLTVTQMEFSHNDEWLLTVSRDRGFALFKRNTSFEMAGRQSKAHGRIVWSCSFTHDDQFFLTSSRDKTIKIWSMKDVNMKMSAETTLELEESVTAVAAAPTPLADGRYIAMVGLDNGTLLLIAGQGKTWNVHQRLQSSLYHTAAVRRISWRPKPQHEGDPSKWLVATAGDDHAVKLVLLSL